MTSNTRSPNGAWRSICSVVALVSSSVTHLGYACSAGRCNSPAHRLRRLDAAVGQSERDPARDFSQDLGDRTDLARNIDDRAVQPGGLDPAIRQKAGILSAAQEVERRHDRRPGLALPDRREAALEAQDQLAGPIERRRRAERVARLEPARDL